MTAQRSHWKPGDLAQCVSLLGTPRERARGVQLLQVYVIVGVTGGVNCHGLVRLGLRLSGHGIDRQLCFDARGFSKIPPLAVTREDQEIIRAMRGEGGGAGLVVR